MRKTVRAVLYVLSALTVTGVLAAFILAGKNQKTQQTMQDDAHKNTEASGIEQLQPPEKEAAAEEETEKWEAAGEQTEKWEAAEEHTEKWEATEEETEKWEAAGETSAEDSEKVADTTIIFTGDVLFANAFKAGYDANGISGVLSEELLLELNQADILVINNEFPFSDRGTPMPDKQYTFRCSPSYVEALNEMGVDVASLANNHTLDYGKDALLDTFAALDQAGIRYAGAGTDAARAEQVQVIEVNGKKFGFLAVSRVIPTADWKIEFSTPGLFSCYDDTRLIELVREAKQTCDYLAVYPHWGVEHAAYPEDYQEKIAERCIEAGADVIVGSHTHCLQGISYINGKPVFYSLGNFIFGQSIDRSAIVKVTVNMEGIASYQYLPVYASGGVTRFAEGTQAGQTRQYVSQISSNAEITAEGIVTEVTK